jgi:hypothetical protein
LGVELAVYVPHLALGVQPEVEVDVLLELETDIGVCSLDA